MKIPNIILFEIGICALEDANLIYRKKFDNPEIEFSSIIRGEKNYLSDLIPKLRNYNQVRVNNKNLIEIFQRENIDVKLMSDSRLNEINQNKLDLITKFGLSNDRDELVAILQKFAINLSSMKVKETSEKLDLHLVQAINTLDELDEIITHVLEVLCPFLMLEIGLFLHLIFELYLKAFELILVNCQPSQLALPL